MQKYRISTNIGKDQLVTVDIKQDYDLLEILSLKFTQKDIYSSFCADYGVVCGRITSNNGLGIPNARVSIFIPMTDTDTSDPVISKLYPYQSSADKNDDGYRYNLLPSRKQHGGHVPTGTFPDQTDILTREETLEVYEKYYNFTVKTNISGDYMIWGVPLGKQLIHVDVDLSDMGCFSLRPYDFVRQGIDENRFDRFYNFKSDSDIDGLPQIVSFDKTIDVFPFWGNQDLCQIGITRSDFDISEKGIKVEPISLMMLSSVTDSDGDAVKRTGVIRFKTGYKCALETKPGKLEGIRYTGRKVYGSDGVTIYPELEYFNPGIIDENGSALAIIPMNMEYMHTNEFGEQEMTNDPNKGVPTTTVARFRASLSIGNQTGTKGTEPANYLIPNIREFNKYTNGDNPNGEYSEPLLSTYLFSDVFEDYFNLQLPTGVTFDSSTRLSTADKNHKKDLLLGTYNDGIPEDYFYKFIYGKVYTPSSFQGSHYEVSAVESFFGLSRRDAFLGIKEIRPNAEDDCTGNANYVPTNFGFRNRIKFGLLISSVLLFIQFVIAVIIVKFFEFIGRFLLSIGKALYAIYFGWPFNWRPFAKIGEQFQDAAYTMQDRGTKVLPLTVYPDCEECSEDAASISSDKLLSAEYYCVGELKCKVFGIGEFYSQVLLIVIDINMNTTTGTTFSNDFLPGASARDITPPGATDFISLTGATKANTRTILSSLQNSKITPSAGDINDSRYIAQIFPKIDDTILPFSVSSGDKPAAKSDSFTDTIFNFNISNPELANAGMILNGTFGSWNRYFWDQSNGTHTYGNKLHDWFSVYGDWNGGKALTFQFSHEQWANLAGGNNYANYSGGRNGAGNMIDRGTYAVIKIYDRKYKKVDPLESFRPEMQIEVGCKKYDKLYDESNSLKYLWAQAGVEYSDSHIPTFPQNGYPVGYVESANTQSGTYTVMADICAGQNTVRMPRFKAWGKIGNSYYDRKTKSGYSEVRDGVFTAIPVIEGTSKNLAFILEWYKRKRVGMFFCGGVVNYSFIDNWLHGLLYFFKFDYRIKWDDVDVFDLNQRGSKFPRELLFYNVLDQKFYYRSSPYNPTTKQFIGQKYNGYLELLHPTTFYDVGVRDEFYKEICYDPRVDPNCSVIRDLSVTSYQDPGYVLEHVINYRMDASNAKFDVGDFFNGGGYDFGWVLDGDITQLISINCEAGIEAFDLDTSFYFNFNGEFLDPEDPNYTTYFKNNGGSWGPTPIDFKLDKNGRVVRLCLNNRLGDYTQKVPFFLWNKNGEGFGISDNQKWDRNRVGTGKLQRMVSIGNVGSTTTNYLMADGEEEFILKPMTKDHPLFSWDGNYTDMIERFDIITETGITLNAVDFVEGDLWLEVLTGTLKSPTTGNIRVVYNQAWSSPISYIKDSKELFIFQTKNNYSGNLQVLSTPFLFYFGLRPGSTSYDKFIKYYGPKGAFPSAD